MIDKEESKAFIQKRLNNYSNLKENYHNSVGLVFLSTFILIFSSCYLYYSFFHYETPSAYLALTEDNKLLNEKPLSQMHIEDHEVIMWANNALINIYTYDYLNYEKHGVKVTDYFYETALQAFMKDFNSLNLQKIVNADRAVVKPEILEIFEIKERGTFTTGKINKVKRQYLKLEGSVLLKIYGISGTKAIRYKVGLHITREFRSKQKDGLSIAALTLIKR